MESGSVDVALMATVLHDLVEAGTAAGALAEVSRVIKAEGRLAIVEFHKIDGPPGPPRHIRLTRRKWKRWWPPTGLPGSRSSTSGLIIT